MTAGLPGGGLAVGYRAVALALSEVLGRPISYRPITLEDARSRMAARGIPPALIDASLAIASYQKEGGATAMVSPSVERLLGRPPHTIHDFVRDYAEAFRR